MTLQSQVHQRASGQCELCGSASDTSLHALRPSQPPTLDTLVLVCGTCEGGLAAPKSLAVEHWYCLREAMWSEHTAVKVSSYRILKGLGDSAYARDLLEQIYLDEPAQSWADEGLASESAEAEASLATVDSNGTPLETGDSVTLIKDLDVKGANFTAKRGTLVKGITLSDDPKFVEGRVNGIRIVLVAAYLKKV